MNVSWFTFRLKCCPLLLHNIVLERRYGFGSILCIKCDNCAWVSANTKLAKEVNTHMQLSPGLFTGKWANRLDVGRRHKKLFSSTVEAKRHRRQLKQGRLESSAAKEILEGTTYQSNVDLKDGSQQIRENAEWPFALRTTVASMGRYHNKIPEKEFKAFAKINKLSIFVIYWANVFSMQLERTGLLAFTFCNHECL